MAIKAKMNKLYFLIISALLLSYSAEAAYINFNITSPANPDIQLIYDIPGQKDRKILRLKLREGTANVQLDIRSNTIIDVFHGDNAFKIFLRPSDDLTAAFDGLSPKQTLRFSGSGQENNQLLADYVSYFVGAEEWKYRGAYLTSYIPYATHDKAGAVSPVEYFQWIQGRKSEMENFLVTNMYAGSASSDLKTYLRDEIKYNIETDKLAYFLINKDKMGPGDFNRLKTHYIGNQRVGFMDNDLIKHPAYVNFITTYAHYLYLPNDIYNHEVALQYYNLIEKNMMGRAKYFLQSKLMTSVFNYENDTDLAAKKFSSFKKNCPYQEYVDNITEIYGGAMTDVPDAPAPIFKFYNKDGSTADLSAYRGKVVFISVWAKWCKPCIKNFEKSESIRAQLKKMGVVLLNASIDNDDMSWKSALSMFNPYGTNVRVTDVRGFKQQYGISTIPAYFIVDRHGKLAYLSDDTNRDLIQEFRDIQQR